ncbi:hypothetical protein HY570_02560 [Candidatus Micrarchaeota archaeon]|nr:hypothetical protein [Candidatus Micrarchaeota archaeon]
MRFFDLHVKFEFKDFQTFGFHNIGVNNSTIIEVVVNNSNQLSKKIANKINIVNSTSVELLKKGIKKFDLVYFPGFYLDSTLIRAVAENKKAFEIPISDILNVSGIKRAYIMGRIRQFLRLCNRSHASYVLTSRAKDTLEVKAPSEMIAIGEILGLTKDQAIRAITETPESILRKVLR